MFSLASDAPDAFPGNRRQPVNKIVEPGPTILPPPLRSQRTRSIHALAFVLIWMALGWLLRVDAYFYLLLGIPLCVAFQLWVARKPLSAAWVRDVPSISLDWKVVALTLVFAIVPILSLWHDWKRAPWGFRADTMAAVVGALGVAFALRRANSTTWRSLLLCLATAGIMGCSMMLLAALAKHHGLKSGLRPLLFAAQQFSVLLPTCFVMEEVAFRGILDSYVHRPGDDKPWLSAAAVSIVWGWWHLPLAPMKVLPIAVILFPLVHLIPGVPFSLLWRKSGNLLVPASVHALIDAIRNAYV